MREYQPPAPTIPRSRGHHRDWIDACKGGPPSSANFEYAARLTEIVLLGAVALQSGQDVELGRAEHEGARSSRGGTIHSRSFARRMGAVMKNFVFVFLCLALGAAGGREANACSTILVGRSGTADGSVLMSHSCDGDVMGLVYVMPAQSYPPGTRLPMYWNVPRPTTYAEYQADLAQGI